MIISDLSYLEAASEEFSIIGGSKCPRPPKKKPCPPAKRHSPKYFVKKYQHQYLSQSQSANTGNTVTASGNLGGVAVASGAIIQVQEGYQSQS